MPCTESAINPCSRCGTSERLRFPSGRSRCRECNRHQVNQGRTARRATAATLVRELIERAGGVCLLCGWRPASEAEYAALDMHHVDPSEKRFRLSEAKDQPVTAVVAEAAKCVPLCARCHRLHHASAA